jgi:glutamine amidotransferase
MNVNGINQKSVAVVVTGASNIASLEAALFRIGARPFRVTTPEDTKKADYVILPGVGAFGPVAATLRQTGLTQALRERIAADKPTMAICLGMQLLFAASAESPGSEGLGVVDGQIDPLSTDAAGRLKAHFGWARVGDLSQNDYAYFAHSFAARSAPPEWQPRYAEANPRFVAGLRRGAVVGCQYHPEISGRFGTEVLTNWLAGGGS